MCTGPADSCLRPCFPGRIGHYGYCNGRIGGRVIGPIQSLCVCILHNLDFCAATAGAGPWITTSIPSSICRCGFTGYRNYRRTGRRRRPTYGCKQKKASRIDQTTCALTERRCACTCSNA